MNRKAKGARLELYIKALFEEAGYTVVHSSASLSPWDLVAIRKDGVLLVQVKTGRFPRSREFDALLDAEVPDCVTKLLVVKKDRELLWYTLG